ncbi:cbb3-type cytochrome oxidase assembly protein CcoS [Ferrimonas marina]|uniref:Cytochrome oxidase maturation protein, cbb3-type n=1 Tax=Ferrimonas marina TaxID=299255 RepID=A0A1M5NBY3_9GAMM|nr:cbb3-type cytochrome oxidase assembly protein CcoS [Ferrimonas marina]SHG87126.1 cytochrome oxidase maturation protein, cbb3-type [Ferrimonas marina]
MSIIYILIPIAILFVCLAVALFFWSVKSRQYEDLDREGYSILFDDDKTPPKDPK